MSGGLHRPARRKRNLWRPFAYIFLTVVVFTWDIFCFWVYFK